MDRGGCSERTSYSYKDKTGFDDSIIDAEGEQICKTKPVKSCQGHLNLMDCLDMRTVYAAYVGEPEAMERSI